MHTEQCALEREKETQLTKNKAAVGGGREPFSSRLLLTSSLMHPNFQLCHWCRQQKQGEVVTHDKEFIPKKVNDLFIFTSFCYARYDCIFAIDEAFKDEGKTRHRVSYSGSTKITLSKMTELYVFSCWGWKQSL